MEWLYVVAILWGIGFFMLGYGVGAKRILKEWKMFNREYYEEVQDECMHGDDFDYCPDCRH